MRAERLGLLHHARGLGLHHVLHEGVRVLHVLPHMRQGEGVEGRTFFFRCADASCVVPVLGFMREGAS